MLISLDFFCRISEGFLIPSFVSQKNGTKMPHNCIPDEHYIQTLFAVSVNRLGKQLCFVFAFLLRRIRFSRKTYVCWMYAVNMKTSEADLLSVNSKRGFKLPDVNL